MWSSAVSPASGRARSLADPKQETRQVLGPDRPITLAYYPDGRVRPPTPSETTRHPASPEAHLPHVSFPVSFLRKQEAYLKDLGIADDADLLHMMTYDQNQPQHSSVEFAQRAMKAGVAAGLPPEKLTLGVPFYGRNSRTGDWTTYEVRAPPRGLWPPRAGCRRLPALLSAAPNPAGPCAETPPAEAGRGHDRPAGRDERRVQREEDDREEDVDDTRGGGRRGDDLGGGAGLQDGGGDARGNDARRDVPQGAGEQPPGRHLAGARVGGEGEGGRGEGGGKGRGAEGRRRARRFGAVTKCRTVEVLCSDPFTPWGLFGAARALLRFRRRAKRLGDASNIAHGSRSDSVM